MSSLRRRAALATAVALALGVVGSAGAEPPPSTEFTKRIIVQPGFGFENDETNDYCTAGFLLRDRRGAVYTVTDAHCAPNGRFKDGAGVYDVFVGSRTWASGRGPAVNRVQRIKSRVGRYAVQVAAPTNRELNYALVRLDPGTRYDGTVAVVGGPSFGIYSGATTGPTRLTYVCDDGYAVGHAQGAETRYLDGVQQDVAPDGLRRVWFNVAAPAEGSCAGAPVILGGVGVQAVGINGGYLGGGLSPDSSEGRLVTSTNIVYRLDTIVADAQKRVGERLQLVPAGESGVTKR